MTRKRLLLFVVGPGLLVLGGAPCISLATSICQGDLPPNVKKLIDESGKKRTMKASLPFQETRLKATDLSAAIAFIKSHPDYHSYHLLHAIKRDASELYKKIDNQVKAAILCSALKNVAMMNDWSYLDPSFQIDHESAKSLLQIGKDGVPFLIPILDDARGARWEGSKTATASIGFNYRRKDFAYRYILIINGKSPAFHGDSTVRDKQIESLKAELKMKNR